MDRRTGTSLARLGLTGEDAATTLRGLGWWATDGPVPGCEEIMWALARSPDQSLALRAVERLAQTAPWPAIDRALRTDRGLRGRLFATLGSSTALGDHLVRHPDRWPLLADTAERGDPPPDLARRTANLLRAVGADPDAPTPGTVGGARASLTGAEAVAALRTAYRDELLGLASADLAAVGDPELPVMEVDDVAAQLADLAEAALAASLAVAAAEQDPPDELRLAIIGMGKCGGRELNYVSDVDVVFVAEPGGDLTPAATKLASRVMRVAGEACFEVDANLRPEGRQGALVRTLDGHVSYYRRWAKTWEFQALLKARPIAGDPELGRSYVEALDPMVWQACTRDDFVGEVQAMRARVIENIPSDQRERELKLGRGGLRDVEFAVQLLQLVHGRTDDTLHSGNTLVALAALSERGYVGRDDGANLAASYRFLRLLEHRLQLQKLRRTHLLPAVDDTDGLRWLARAARIRPDGRRDVVGVLVDEWQRNARRVTRLHEKLFYRPLLSAVSRLAADGADAVLTPEAAKARMKALGWASPEGALGHLRALTGGVSRAASIQRALLPVLLDSLSTSPDPDRGLLAYRRVSEALADTPWYLRLLRDEGAVAQRLMTLLGTSALVPDLLARAPEVLRMLAISSGVQSPELTRDPAEVSMALRTTVARQATPEIAVASARSYRRHEMLRVACADLLGLLPVDAVCAALNSVNEAVLAATLDAVLRAETERPAALAVIGMGRLGGGESSYGSDADVMFVCAPAEGVDDHTAVRWATRVVERVRRLLGSPSPDPALPVDADLRPEGRSGPMVRTLASYREYYARWGEVWEAQALLRARPIAGDRTLGREFTALVDPIRYPADGLSAASVSEIRRIKARVDAERLPRGADRSTHTKLGLGGLADVEWTVQLLQLQHAGDVPELRTPSTLEGLHEAAEAGLIGAEDAAELEEGWRTATAARNAIMLVKGKPGDQLPRSGRELAAVAVALGYPAGGDPGEFLDDYKRVTRRARAVVERVFYGWSED
ncbi:Glutamate-ammonia-ligase adenylyltransferase [Pseudonocardia sp. Ae406_Ps2]|uniref:bifunctional [glutamine synthetase] adenylyltransferase/[glutamine synthetase]-adenylyl-L-tyrosine phosphorylase n=1 Tax=unclassified Pseudonocardia TaxID=2619320 RepID=UPI00094AC2E6|nr:MULTISPECIES: bifunctional [glutamine synthetase] adenylyltransferase/[glutamine synthetase]-adenylyl-L-tyrosine phosphorylase [unclassified Pseudonocardia]OLM01706.1 Glutamate-ammonia-ligase adenylyltransferase [Pseudonocardia sp. Ae406_Ps2]OLM06510.1 Glutamate-ammonia-ligase adenylyltransferase [Pseudonocardia sp. Ae331_Ps2]OLM13248.1 Glutamate-ammonia-ligase adenylyltransferase [Pseudonocardia sp. Ae505_Ps2]OLM23278.1 Glutamate-ammonia-ligase adenylyltransferase [Pseudonocardia sp. Ae706_